VEGPGLINSPISPATVHNGATIASTLATLCSAFLFFFTTQIALELNVLDAEVAHRDAAETAGLVSPYVANLVEMLRNVSVTTLVVKILGVLTHTLHDRVTHSPACVGISEIVDGTDELIAQLPSLPKLIRHERTSLSTTCA